VIKMSLQFTTEDADLLTALVMRAFRASRMGNARYCERQLRIIKSEFGDIAYRKVSRAIREDRRTSNVHSG
jgi:hypothetical protein